MTLDDIRRIDKNGMYDLVLSVPDQWREGRSIALKADLPVTMEGKNQLVVAGMGGSAIAGDLVRTYAADEAAWPVTVVRNYTLPASVDERSVVVISSFSGNTEETLAVLHEALDRKATVICISSGGTVKELAESKGLPYVRIPGGMPPRAALGYSLSVQLTVAERIGLVAPGNGAWDEAQALLESLTEAYRDPTGSHLAMELARSLKDLYPYVYSAAGLMEAVSLRWRGQFQENSKKLASGNVYPELNHNEIMGWEVPGATHRMVGVVVLRDRGDHPRILKRMDVTKGLLAERAGFWKEVEAQGNAKLARMMSLIVLGDWVSLYLGLLRNVDPTPIGLIDKLKIELAKV